MSREIETDRTNKNKQTKKTDGSKAKKNRERAQADQLCCLFSWYNAE